MYPKMILPMSAYTPDMLKRISSDPIFQDFMDFRDKQIRQSRELGQAFETEDENDLFKYGQNQPDPYFGGYGEPEWGSSWDFRPIRQNQSPDWQACNPNNVMPSYFI